MKDFLKKIINKVKERGGYSLAELSISTSILAMLAVGALAIIDKKNEADKESETYAKLERIEKAMTSFIRVNKYVPCPADPSLLSTETNFGRSAVTSPANETGACDVAELVDSRNVGAIPVRTINLPDEYTYDGWGRKFTYRSTENSGGPPPAGVDPYLVNELFKADLAVVDNKGIHKTDINNPAPYNDGALYVIISHGANGKNVAWGKEDDTAPASLATGKELPNTDHSTKTYVQASASSNFDDIVAYGLKKDFLPPKIISSPIKVDKLVCENAKEMENDLTNKNTYLDNFATASGDADLAAQISIASRVIADLCKDENDPTNSINPTKITGLKVWLDAKDYKTMFTDSDCTTGPEPANATEVGCWLDKSGNELRAVRSSSASKPRYYASAIEGSPALKFNGTTQSLSSTSNLPLDAGDDSYTYIAVWQSATSNATRVVFEQNASTTISGARAALLLGSSATYGFDGESNDQNTLSPYSADTAYITYMENDNGTINLYSNGTFYTGGINNTTANVSTYAFFVGKRNNNTEWMNGDIGEIAVYDRVLNSTDRNGLQNYLSDKWGITLSTGSSNFCPQGMSFEKTADRPEGACKCADGTVLLTELDNTNACYVSAKSSFGGCVAVDTEPDYLNEGLTEPLETGMFLWLDANDCTTITIGSGDTSAVAQWADKSGSGNNLAQSNTSLQPTYVRETLNNRSVVRFDGSDRLSSTTTPTFNDNQTVYFVLNDIDTSSGSDNKLYQATGASQVMYISSSQGEAYSLSNGTALYSSIAATGDTSILAGFYENTRSRIRVNGQEIVDGDAGSSSSSGVLNLGSDSSSSYYNGDISEVIMYDRIIGANEITNIETYLSDKWDILVDPSDAGTNNLVLWLDSNDTSTVLLSTSCSGTNAHNGDTVSCWKDKSGNGNNAIQSVQNDKPLYRFNSIDSKPTIEFDGSKSLSGTAPLASGDDTYSIISVWKSDTNNASRVIWEQNSTTITTGLRAALKLTSSGYGFDGESNNQSSLSSYSVATPYISYLENNNGTINLYHDGGTVDTGSINATTANLSSEAMFVGKKSNDSEYMDGNIAEIIVYDSILTNKERLYLQEYLSIKWGITIP